MIQYKEVGNGVGADKKMCCFVLWCELRINGISLYVSFGRERERDKEAAANETLSIYIVFL